MLNHIKCCSLMRFTKVLHSNMCPNDQMIQSKVVPPILVPCLKNLSCIDYIYTWKIRFRSKDKEKSPSTTSFLDYLTSNQPPLEATLVHKRTQTDPLPEPPRPPPAASQSSASTRSGKGGPQIKFNSDEIKQHVTKECNNAAGKIAERIPPIEDTLRTVF